MRLASVIITVAWGLFALLLYEVRDTAPDLAALFIAARLLRNGKDAHVYDHDVEYFDSVSSLPWLEEAERIGTTFELFPYVYAPLWAALLAPVVCEIGYAAFRAAVTVLDAAAFAGTILIVAARWAPTFLRPLPLALVLGAAFASRPVVQGILLGQLQPVVILLGVLAMTASQSRRPAAAGLALASAAAVKILPGVLALYWLATGRRSSAAWFFVFIAMFALASLALAGWGIHLAFLQTLERVNGSIVLALANQSLPAWLAHFAFPSSEMFTARIHSTPMWIRAASMSLAALTVVVVILIARSRPLDQKADAAAMVLLMLVVTITAPIAWAHYYGFLIVAALMIVESGGWLIACAVAALTSIPLYDIGVSFARNGSTLFSWSELAAGVICASALLLQIVIRRQAGRHRE